LQKIKQQKQAEGKKHRVNCLVNGYKCNLFTTNISLAKLYIVIDNNVAKAEPKIQIKE
jgi:hypothetical protein